MRINFFITGEQIDSLGQWQPHSNHVVTAAPVLDKIRECLNDTCKYLESRMNRADFRNLAISVQVVPDPTPVLFRSYYEPDEFDYLARSLLRGETPVTDDTARVQPQFVVLTPGRYGLELHGPFPSPVVVDQWLGANEMSESLTLPLLAPDHE